MNGRSSHFVTPGGDAPEAAGIATLGDTPTLKRAAMLRRFLATKAMADKPLGPIASSVVSKIQHALNPASVHLVNESHKHAGHWVDDGSAASTAGETHFKLEVVSESFAGLPLVKRHQLIYGLLSDELKAGLHALSMTLKTPAEIATK